MTQAPHQLDRCAFSKDDAVTLLKNNDALATLKSDLAWPGPVFIWCFLLDDEFFTQYFAAHLQHSEIHALVDAHQIPATRHLLAQFSELHAWTWSSNRTMHDKSIIIPTLNVTYLTTSNLTRGSWSLSHNRCARIESRSFACRMLDDFLATTAHARRLTPSKE